MKVFIIGATEPGCCELCGDKKELRPYGPNGENICHPCGMKDKKTTESMMLKCLEQGAIDVEDLGALIRGQLKRH